ncbi:hypothetical protein B4U80_09404 [Leptotrombidium deliense]|uniref:Proteasome subunit beta type-1-like protein n=1 Tax=Leptotrombidium deliense TaxID=299467 RepID=A0A443SLP5_9ACAR|nr:hypothetical protein B4U80_09404 [Leptotrombidium deliense]
MAVDLRMFQRNEQVPATMSSADVQHQRFSPYADNGGSIAAIAGEDYAIIAGDTRLSAGFNIYTRKQTKLFQLTPHTVFGSTGCWCDVLTFVKMMEAKLRMYSYEHNKTMTTEAISQLVSVMLYHKRFFPYYITNVVCGLDENGKGVIYSYDPVGHRDSVICSGTGSASTLIQPLLDNQAARKNIADPEEAKKKLSKEEAINLIRDAFNSATERSIQCGDSISMSIVTKKGIESLEFALRKD